MNRKLRAEIRKYPGFFQKVWIACSRIPAGKTKTYRQVAEEIGHPRACRAVGTALSKNPFAPEIPCHRVVCSSGDAGNYSGKGGRRKKIQLLMKEGARGY